MRENIHLAFQGVWSHKLRSILTMLGIIIGIAAIITIVSTIKGTNEQIKQNLIGSGTNAVTVNLYQDDYEFDLSYSGNPEGVSVISDETKASLLNMDGVKGVSLFRHRGYTDGVFYGNTAYNGDLYGIDRDYFSVYNYGLTSGRWFIDSDYGENRKVAIVDAKAVTTLFSGIDPVGKTIEIMAEPFVIVGVVDLKDTFTPVIETLSDYYLYADTTSGHLFVPDAVWPIIYRFDEPQSVAVKAASTDDMAEVGKAVADSLTASQIADPENSNFSYQNRDVLEYAQQLQEMSNATNRQLIWIASISLLVGGIGVMNIMLVSVAERISEIGLKKAIGAKKRRILGQFLTEAAVLTSTGGVIGVLAGIGLASALSKFTGTPSAISVPAIVIAVVFSMVIGIVFGLLPAFKAANMNPIEALKRE